MKKKTLITMMLLIIKLTSYSQNSFKTPIDFVTDKCLGYFRPDTIGKISFQPNCNNNNPGQIKGYLIHKNGGSWWYNNAKKRFPNNIQNCEYKMAKRLLKEDKDSLINYNKWLFYVDEKYMEPVQQENGETGEKYIAYYIKETTPFEEILYQRLVGEMVWREIERKRFNTYTDYRKATWRIDFIKKKLAESNSIK